MWQAGKEEREFAVPESGGLRPEQPESGQALAGRVPVAGQLRPGTVVAEMLPGIVQTWHLRLDTKPAGHRSVR
jgi:hypothetical protein